MFETGIIVEVGDELLAIKLFFVGYLFDDNLYLGTNHILKFGKIE